MHMKVKNWLFSRKDMDDLSRKKIFPLYTNQLRLKFLNRELAKG